LEMKDQFMAQEGDSTQHSRARQQQAGLRPHQIVSGRSEGLTGCCGWRRCRCRATTIAEAAAFAATT
jgi:hypothetical protein